MLVNRELARRFFGGERPIGRTVDIGGISWQVVGVVDDVRAEALDLEPDPWVYVDPEVSQVVGQVNRFNRVERWLYNGLHTLDFSFLYYNRPVWDVTVIVFSLGGAFVSAIGLFMGLKRLRRGASRFLQQSP